MILPFVTLLEIEDKSRPSIWCLFFDFPNPSSVVSFFLLSLRPQMRQTDLVCSALATVRFLLFLKLFRTQGFCTCCSFWLIWSFFGLLLPLVLKVFIQISSAQWGLPWLSYFKMAPLLFLISLSCFIFLHIIHCFLIYYIISRLFYLFIHISFPHHHTSKGKSQEGRGIFNFLFWNKFCLKCFFLENREMMFISFIASITKLSTYLFIF